jgi:hypothetical protein
MLIATLALLSLVSSQDDPAKKIDELIKQLGSDEFAVREKASDELKKIGKPAEEALRKAAEKSDDAEVRERARTVLDSIAQAEKPKAQAPRRGAPGWPGLRGLGSSVTVQSVNGDSTYKITPGNGNPPLTLHKSKAGAVKLEYTDEKGEAKTAEAESLEKFVKEQKELAEKFGITEDGIDYGGSRVNFKGGFQAMPIPRAFRIPMAPVPPTPLNEEEKLRAAGATFEKVGEALRAQLELPEGQGLVVLKVEEGGAAEISGLRKNDILLEIDGKKVASLQDVKENLKKSKTTVVLRKGRKESLTPSDPKKDY